MPPQSLETLVALQADLPKHIPVEDRELAVFPDREFLDIPLYGENMRYSLVTQEKPAPLIFVIAGTDAGYNSEKMQVLQRAIFRQGFMFCHCLPRPIPTGVGYYKGDGHTYLCRFIRFFVR